MGIVVSVVIPTRKRNDLLKRCLDALLTQTLAQSAYEVIVVDDAPSAETRRMVREYAQRELPRISYLAQRRKHGPASARNLGWQAAEGRIIAFTDDDCLPEPDWLAQGTSGFGHDVDGISGRVIVPCGPRPNDYERNSACLERSEFVTANCFYRKDVLADVGGFDERFTAAWREDADLFFTLLSRSRVLRTAPEAVVVHPVRTAGWGASIREQRKSMFNALLYRKHPVLYRKKINNPLLGCYYAIVLSSLLALLSFASGKHGPGAAGLSVWIACTGWVCLKRLRGASHSAGHILEMLLTSGVIPFQSVYWRLTGAVKFSVFFY